MKRYLIDVIAVFIATLCCGVITGLLTLAIMGDGSWSFSGLFMMCLLGASITAIPTAGYALLLVSFFRVVPRSAEHRPIAFAITGGLSLAIFFVATRLAPDIPEMGELIFASLLAGLAGTEVLIRRKKGGQQSAAPLPSAPQTGPSEGAR